MKPPYLEPSEKQRLRQIRLRWENRICTAKPLEPAATRDAIEEAYQWLGYPSPEIIFVDSPQAALDVLIPFARPQIVSWRWWRLIQRIWYGCWVLPAIIANYVIIAMLFCGVALLANLGIALLYWIVTLFLPYLPPPKQSPLMAEIYTFFYTIAAILAIPVSLWFIPLFMRAVDESILDIMNKFGLLDRRFRRRFGDLIKYDFSFRLFAEPYSSLRRSYEYAFWRSYYSPKILNYIDNLQNIDRHYREQKPTQKMLAREFQYHSLLLGEGYLHSILEVSTLEFKLADFPDTPQFRQWWEVYRNLLADCYLFIPYTKVCIVCDRAVATAA